MDKTKIIALTALITLVFGVGAIANALAGENKSKEIIKFTGSPKLSPLYPPPPYLQFQAKGVNIVFEADEASIREVLPPELEPAAGNTAGLAMLTIQNGVGLAPFTAAYVYVDVKDFDVDGNKGRWMAYGWYCPDRAMAAVREVLGFPAKLGATELKREGDSIQGILTRDGVKLIEASIALKGSLGIQGGMMHYLTMKEPPAAHGTQSTGSELILNRFPFMAEELFLAEPLSMLFQVSDKDPLKKLEPKRLLGAFYFNNVTFAFGYTDVVKKMR